MVMSMGLNDVCVFVCLQHPEAAGGPSVQPTSTDIWTLLETQSLSSECETVSPI